MKTNTTSPEFFDAIYSDGDDPWQFATSQYENDRYERIVGALRGRSYKLAFEPGCSIGVLTAKLASICEHVDAMDFSHLAVERAQQRCRALENVTIRCGSLPGDIPSEMFDLIVFSEVGYYFSLKELKVLAERLIQQMKSSAVFLAAHWLGTSKDHILSGDQVHTLLESLPGLEHEYSERTEGFRLDRWTKQ